MLNHIILIGRLVRDVELRQTSGGAPVARSTLAVDRRQVKDRDKKTDYIDVVVWQKTAEACAKYIGKGRLVAVSGRLRLNHMGMRYGLDDPRVIAMSHVVDRLHTEWERMVRCEGY